MKRNGFIFMVLVLVIAFAGCAHNSSDHKNPANEILNARNNTSNGKPPTGDQQKGKDVEVKKLEQGTYQFQTIQDKYPDKTVLVYAVEQGETPDDTVVDSINDYLIKQGTDYVVWFKEVNVHKDSNYTNQILKENHSDEPIDIIYCALPTPDDPIAPYDAFIQRGILKCFDAYLNSEKGQSLLQSLPKSSWEALKRNDKIYGINGYTYSISTPMSYYVNKKLMDKYHLTKEDLHKPLAELSDIFTKVEKGEKDRKQFSVITTSLAFKYPQYRSVTNTVVLNEKSDKGASLLLDCDGYLKYLKALQYYQSLSMLGKQTQKVDDFFLQANLSSGVPFEKPDYGSFIDQDGNSAGQEDVVQIIFDEYASYTNQYKFATGVNSASKHTDMAFDFLSRVFTKDYISNLLLYGIENIHYVTKDGKLPPNTDYGFRSVIFGNSYITLPLDFEYKNKKELYFKIQNSAKTSKYANFIFDQSKVSQQINDTDQVMEQLSQILEGKVSDFDQFIHKLKQQLNDKGAQDIIDEVNKQRKES